MSQKNTETDDVSMTFVVNGEEFETHDEALDYSRNLKSEMCIETAADVLTEVFGEDAVGNLEDHFGVSFKTIVETTVESRDGLLNDYDTGPSHLVGGQVLGTVARKLSQNNGF